MDHQHPLPPPPAPTPLCAAYAPQLALISGTSLDAASADLRAHVAGCAWCQAKLASFDIVDGALRRHLGPQDTVGPYPTLAEIAAVDDRASAAPPVVATAAGRRGTVVRWSSAWLAVACTLALILVAGGVFTFLPRHAGAPIPSVTRAAPTATVAPTATPLPACAQLPGGATLFAGLLTMPDLTLPPQSYISAPLTTGGGVGQYTVQSYTVCFPGQESLVDGDVYTPSANPTSSLGKLVRAGWTLNHMFPDSYDFAWLDQCTGVTYCLNDGGTPNPFTFLSVDQFAAQSGGVTIFRLQVATIAAPVCLNDPTYYAGTPHYTLYEEGNDFSKMTATYYFPMPPATRVSDYARTHPGSQYRYFCSAGTPATILSILERGMQSNDYTLTQITPNGFVATKGSGPIYEVDVNVPSAGNYSLRIYPPR